MTPSSEPPGPFSTGYFMFVRAIPKEGVYLIKWQHYSTEERRRRCMHGAGEHHSDVFMGRLGYKRSGKGEDLAHSILVAEASKTVHTSFSVSPRSDSV